MRNLSDTTFYRKVNLLQDFYTCISVSLIWFSITVTKRALASSLGTITVLLRKIVFVIKFGVYSTILILQEFCFFC